MFKNFAAKNFVTRLAVAAVVALVVASNASARVANSPSGMTTGHYRILAGHQHTFNTISFVGGETATVYVEGDGSTDLDLYVFDQYGQLVAYDDDNTDDCLARWVPARTGFYRIVIVNRSDDDYNDYFMSAS
jgi:hypothetical protein